MVVSLELSKAGNVLQVHLHWHSLRYAIIWNMSIEGLQLHLRREPSVSTVSIQT